MAKPEQTPLDYDLDLSAALEPWKAILIEDT